VSLGHSGSPIHRKSRRCRLGHVISCVQSQLITWDIYTDYQSTDDQCALMISVAPAVPPVSVHQCSSMPPASAHQCQLSVLIHATCQCPSVPAISAHPCHLPVPISATFQCLPVHINATYQCPSELPFCVTHQCHLSVHVS
ncbi:unnamed protein product, partial [Staurois parvus]